MEPEITIEMDTQDPGLATGKAVWPETGVSLTPCPVRLEKWSDGCWRAFGRQHPCFTPKEAMERFLFGDPQRCCSDPQVRGGQCVNCGAWIDDEADLPQGDNEG